MHKFQQHIAHFELKLLFSSETLVLSVFIRKLHITLMCTGNWTYLY